METQWKGSYRKEKNQLIQLLNNVEKGVRIKGAVSPEDLLTVISVTKVVINEAYDRNIQQERSDAVHEQIMREAGPYDFDF
jgi:hypothetical protein